MTIEEFVKKIERPMFSYRMARGMLGYLYSNGYSNKRMRKSATTRMQNAEKEIDLIIREYLGVQNNGLLRNRI